VGNLRRVAVTSDIHYASAEERACGTNYEIRAVKSAWKRRLLSSFRDHVWLRAPTTHNELLDQFLAGVRDCDFAVANGDFCCDTHFVGISHDAAFQSVREVIGKLAATFGDRYRTTYGDHELGKRSFAGGSGAMRLASWQRLAVELGCPPFWRFEMGRYVLIGVASSVLALPVYEQDVLPEELPEWQDLRAAHLKEIRAAFEALEERQRVILFSHDPSALPFLWREPVIQRREAQFEQTFIGHLHSPLVFWKARLLSGVPVIHFLGHTPARWTRALHEARYWRPFKIRLCPALTGIEFLKDGGYWTIELDPDACQPACFRFHRIHR
jgi:hypothetical protein